MKLFPGAILLSVFKLRRLTSLSFLILFLILCQSAFSQSFLKVGNRWDYIHGWWWNGSGDSDTASYYAVSDTTLSNGKTYYIVLPHNQLYGDLIRADSAGIWYYNINCADEWLYYSYWDTIGQVRIVPTIACDTSEWEGVITKTWDTVEVVFGETVRVLVFEHLINMEENANIRISPGLGFLGMTVPGWNANYFDYLMGCIISDTIHGSLIVGVEDTPKILNYSLKQNYPNPFNPSTLISYSLREYSSVVIKIFDILGNEVETLLNVEKPAGEYEVTWHAASLPSGVYFYELRAAPINQQARNFVLHKKMIMIK